jgi:hypothetical protein
MNIYVTKPIFNAVRPHKKVVDMPLRDEYSYCEAAEIFCIDITTFSSKLRTMPSYKMFRIGKGVRGDRFRISLNGIKFFAQFVLDNMKKKDSLENAKKILARINRHNKKKK